MMPVSAHEVLVSLQHADGTAAWFASGESSGWLAILIAAGLLVCTSSGPASRGFPAAARCKAAGCRRVPWLVEVVDDAGVRHRAAVANAAWVVVLDQSATGPASPVRFLDNYGRTVGSALGGRVAALPRERRVRSLSGL
jgi:hypothetical protein